MYVYINRFILGAIHIFKLIKNILYVDDVKWLGCAITKHEHFLRNFSQ